MWEGISISTSFYGWFYLHTTLCLSTHHLCFRISTSEQNANVWISTFEQNTNVQISTIEQNLCSINWLLFGSWYSNILFLFGSWYPNGTNGVYWDKVWCANRITLLFFLLFNLHGRVQEAIQRKSILISSLLLLSWRQEEINGN